MGQYLNIASGQSFGGLVKAKLIDPDQAIDYPNSDTHGFASFASSDGTLLECPYVMTQSTGHGLGNCKDNRGNQYRLAF